MKYLLPILFILLQGNALLAQSDTTTTQPDTNSSLTYVVLPLVFSSPETSWGFGAATNVTFRFKGEPVTSRRSQFQLGFAYTLNKQLLSYLPFQLFVKDEKYKLYGELGYYKFSYDFYGNGNKVPASNREIFNVNFPRVRLNALYGVNKKWFVGLRYWLDDYDIVKVVEGGLLDTDESINGREGGLLSGGGVVVNYDSRDHLFTPRSGMFAELVLFANQQAFGSKFNFQKIYLDLSYFIPVAARHTLGVHLYSELTAGDPPFNQLSLLGGNKRLRGFYEGRFRDKNYLMTQAEYRLPLFWRFGATAFFSTGRVAPQVAQLFASGWHYTYGGGLRIMLDTKARVNLRIDVAFGPDTSGFYLTFGEAF